MSGFSRKLQRKGSKKTLRTAADAANRNLSYAVKYHGVYDAVVGAINPEFLARVDTLLAASLNGRDGVTHSELFTLTRKAALAVLKTDIAPLAKDAPIAADNPVALANSASDSATDTNGTADHQPENGEVK